MALAQSQEDMSAPSTAEDERYSTKATFFSIDEEYYSQAPQPEASLLQIWPPIERYKFLGDGQSFAIANSALSDGGVGIYGANPECIQAVGSTSFAEWLNGAFGLQSSMRNKVSEAQIAVYIKTMICTRQESYEIQIRPNKIVILAADHRGAIYALNTLKQVIASTASVSTAENNSKIVNVPCMLLSDAPRIFQRALRVSLRFQVVNAKLNPVALVKLFSLLRINTLIVDVDDSENAVRDLAILRELCMEQRIQLIPLLGVSASRNLAESLNAVVCSGFDCVALAEQGGTQFETISQAVRMHPQLSSISVCGDTLQWPANWKEQFSHLQVNEITPKQLRHPSLEDKPLALLWPAIESMVKVVGECASSEDNAIAILPLISERDFLTPDIIIKYFCAQFAAICWRGPGIQQVFDNTAFPSLVETILTLVLRPEDKPAPTYMDTIVKVLTARGEDSSRGPSSAHLVECLGKLERTFWSLFLNNEDNRLPGGIFSHHAVDYPSADDALHCYNYYRQILLSANFKATSQKLAHNLSSRLQGLGSTSHEAEELFSSIDMLALIARTIHLLRSSSEGSASTPGGLEVEAPIMAVSEMQNPQQKRAAVYDNLDMSRPYAPKIYPKSAAIATILTNVVQHNILFRNFKAEEHARIVEAFDCITVKAGETVIKQGDAGEYFYIVESGLLEVYMESCGVHVKIGRPLTQGDYFGELALMYNTPRAATVTSAELSTLWRIDRQTYRTIVARHNKETSDEFYGLISNVHILNKRLGDVLSPAELSKVVSTLEIEEFENDSVIIRQHQTGDYFYIISEGQVDVWQDCVDPVTSQRQAFGTKVATLQRGDYFGEKALLADDVRQASCVAVGRVVCLSLSRDDFIAMIGNWQDLTGVRKHEERKQRQLSIYDSDYHISIHMDDLDRLNTLGVGAFGRVSVARHKESGQLYALKAQTKAGIIAHSMQDMVITEVQTMKMINHPLIAKLHATMQDRKSIYFLLELLPGGEFFTFLQKVGKLSEDKARFYSATVVSAYEELHRKRIAYRDLKPENMVMDARGYVKLVDFGLAKQLVTDATWTMCGTPDYLAPEIILNKGHNNAVDYWALGVLIFEMIHGWPPFYHDQPMRVYEKIILGKVTYPDTFSKPLEDIISKFLVTNPSKRLGNMRGGLADVIKHKWFGSFDWQGLAAGTLSAPYVPDLTDFDTALAAAQAQPPGENDENEEECDWMPEL